MNKNKCKFHFIYYIAAIYFFVGSFGFAQSMAPATVTGSFYASCSGPTYLNRSNTSHPVATGLYYCDSCPDGYTDNGGQINSNSATACRKYPTPYYAPAAYSNTPTSNINFANQNGICEPRFGENSSNTSDCVSGRYANQCADLPANPDGSVRCNPTQDQWLVLSSGGKSALCAAYGPEWGWVNGPNFGYCKYCTPPEIVNSSTGVCYKQPAITTACKIAPCPSNSPKLGTIEQTNNTQTNVQPATQPVQQKLQEKQGLKEFKESFANLSLYSRDSNNDKSVSFLQSFLKEKVCPSLSVSGFFGTKTLACLEQFQNDNGIPTTGIVGPITKSQIINLINK